MKYGKAKSVQLNVMIDESVKVKAKVEATAQGLSLQEWILDAIESKLRTHISTGDDQAAELRRQFRGAS